MCHSCCRLMFFGPGLQEMWVSFDLNVPTDGNLNIRCLLCVIVEHALQEDCVDKSLLGKDLADGDVGDVQNLTADRNQHTGQKRKFSGRSDALML